jgi:transcriptional regulator
MYVPRDFEVTDRGWCHDLIRGASFATLITADAAGLPFATHLPVLLDTERGPDGTLLAHMARANPQWRHFTAGRPVLVMFQGPHAYVSPTWYEVHPSVPTWNYVAVHAYGVPAVVEDPAAARAVMGRLVETYEAPGPAGAWRLEGLPGDYVTRMMQGIVVFEIPIDRLEGKAKLSQNRTAADRARVAAALGASADPAARAVAAFMAAPAAP